MDRRASIHFRYFRGEAMDGVLLLHKPAGMTSHDCVMRIRKLFQTKKLVIQERLILT